MLYKVYTGRSEMYCSTGIWSFSFAFCSDISNVNLSFGDWLDGLMKTVENSAKQETTTSKGI